MTKNYYCAARKNWMSWQKKDNHMRVASACVWIFFYYVIMNSSVACWWIFKVGFSLCICIVSRMFISEREEVLTMRKLLAEILCLNFFAWLLGPKCDRLVSARPDLSDVPRCW